MDVPWNADLEKIMSVAHSQYVFVTEQFPQQLELVKVNYLIEDCPVWQ